MGKMRHRSPYFYPRFVFYNETPRIYTPKSEKMEPDKKGRRKLETEKVNAMIQACGCSHQQDHKSGIQSKFKASLGNLDPVSKMEIRKPLEGQINDVLNNGGTFTQQAKDKKEVYDPVLQQTGTNIEGF